MKTTFKTIIINVSNVCYGTTKSSPWSTLSINIWSRPTQRYLHGKAIQLTSQDVKK